MNPARFSVNQVVLVNLGFVVLMLSGMIISQRIPVDVFPDISFNAAVVITVWPGASPDEVERLITNKIEDEIQDISGIKEWHSFSAAGASEINISWIETMTADEQQASLNKLRAALDRVKDLPPDAEKPFVLELSVAETFDSCLVAITESEAGASVDEYTMREVAKDFQRKVERVDGVLKATLRGARDPELRVIVDKNRALQYDLTLAEISAQIARNNQNMPAGSFTDEAAQEITVRGLGNFVSAEELAGMVVKTSATGNHVRLGEIARVERSFERAFHYTYYDGRRAMLVGVAKQKGDDVSDMVAAVREMVAAELAYVPPGLAVDVVWDTSVFVRKRIDTLIDNLSLGVGLVVLLLWLTVGFRNALLAIIGVPFSFLTALLLFPIFGLTINMLSLIGFVMVSGMLVDDAIIVIENIYRHVEEGEDVVYATINGTREVMWPVIAAICTTVAAFLPMLLLTGTTGAFMSILPKTVIACLMASLLECLFILPAHYIDWGSQKVDTEAEPAGGISGASHRLRAGMDRLLDRGRGAYLVALDRVVARRYSFLVACVAAFYFALGLSAHVRLDLFPSDFNQLLVAIESPVDYGIDQTRDVVLGVQDALAPLAHEISEISTDVGRGITSDELPLFGSNYGMLFIGFADTPQNAADPKRMVRMIQGRMKTYEDSEPTGLASLQVFPPRNGPPVGKPVAVRIVTEDYDLAKRIAGEMKQELASMPGVYNITDNLPVGPRELRVGLDEYRASLHGITFQEVGTALRAAGDGLVPSTFKDPRADEDVDIRVLLEEEQRDSAAELLEVELRTPENYLVKLGDVGQVELERGYERLYHYDAQRTVVVYADVDGKDATSVSANRTLQARFADIPIRYPGVSLVFGGEFQETNEAFADMGRALFVALIAIYAILAAQFRSYLQPLVVMSVIVFAYIGVVIGMYIWDYAISMYVIYAVVGLAGVVVNDSLVLIDFTNKERDRGLGAMEAVQSSGRKRFRAVLLTTLTTVSGLLPMAMGLGGVSSVFGPFAAAIVAGLVVASGLTLFVVPSLYLALEDIKVRILGRRSHAPVDAVPSSG